MYKNLFIIVLILSINVHATKNKSLITTQPLSVSDQLSILPATSKDGCCTKCLKTYKDGCCTKCLKTYDECFDATCHNFYKTFIAGMAISNITDLSFSTDNPLSEYCIKECINLTAIGLFICLRHRDDIAKKYLLKKTT